MVLMQNVTRSRTNDTSSWITQVNQSRVYEAQSTELGSGSQCSIWLSCNVVVDYRAIECNGNLANVRSGKPDRKTPSARMFLISSSQRTRAIVSRRARNALLTMSHQQVSPMRLRSPRCIQIRVPFISGLKSMGRPPSPCRTAKMSRSYSVNRW